MMKRIARCAGLVVGLLSAWGLNAPGGLAADDAPASLKRLEVSGTLIAVDAARGVVTLDRGAVSADTPSQMDVEVGAATVISKAEVALSWTDLQPSGERVTIQYDPPEGSHIVARAILFERPAGLARASGIVERIDLLRGEMTLKPGGVVAIGPRKTFTLNERSLVSQAGQRSYLANLVPGDEVTIDYTTEGDKAVVYSMACPTRPRSAFFERGAWSLEKTQRSPEKMSGYAPSRQ